MCLYTWRLDSDLVSTSALVHLAFFVPLLYLPFYLSTYSIEVKDISLTDYIQVRHAVYLPHTAGRYAKRQFKKAQMPIVERLVDRWGSYAH
jgi:hypothetical protein